MMCNCGYIRNSDKGLYCSIKNKLITNKDSFCIKNVGFKRLKQYIIDNKLCIKKLGYDYIRVCEESLGVCEDCRQLIQEVDING